MAADVARLVGAKGRYNPDRTPVRHGSEPGQVTLGGRRVRIRRPRVRSADGAREVPVPTYQAFAATDLLGELALERMLAKLSTRRYPAGLEPAGGQVERTATGTSRSAVSRRFVTATEHALAELLAQDLTGLDLVALLGRRLPGGPQREPRRWEVNDPANGTAWKAPESVETVAFSPDGHTLASGGLDNNVTLWDVARHTATATLTGHTDQVQGLAFSPHGTTLASVGFDRAIILWDVGSRTRLATWGDQINEVGGVAFSPDGGT